ncbi:MAG: methylmalonyl-CoA mutase family protein [Alsobacter sp.]
MAEPSTAHPLSTAEFPAPTREQWLALVRGVLKGGDFDKVLTGRTADGLRIEPLYDSAQASPVPGRAPGAAWTVIQRIDHPDPEAANRQALEDLQNGAGGLQLVFAGAQGAHGFGLPDASAATLDAVLAGIHLDAGIRLELDLSFACKDAPENLVARILAEGIPPSAVDIAFGYDPLGQFAALGGAPVGWDEFAPMFADLAASIAARGFTGPIAAADGRIVHAAGGSEAQELAWVLASALAYWRALEAHGVPPQEGRRMIGFRLAGDADQFLTLAKTRALRRLWARIEEASGLTPRPIRLHVETAWRMATRRDPWVNLLRATTAVFAAGVAGADSIAVQPFTQALGLPDAFARRLARNTQLVLLEESNLARVADPAAGSGAMEALTGELAAAAWGLLQETEKAGGLYAALAEGGVQREVARVAAERARAIARRKEKLTGTSEFPAIGEQPVAVLAPLPRSPGVRPAWPIAVAPLAPHRIAEPFEALRDAADAAPGGRPVVFLAPLGPVAAFTARATFAKNLFEAGGLAAPLGDGWPKGGGTDIDALVADFRASGARIACLCSSDEVYASEAGAVAGALKAAGASAVWLAGRPGEHEAAWRDAGIETYAFAGCDVLDALRTAHRQLGLDG